MKTNTACQNGWLRLGAWPAALAVLVAQPLVAQSQADHDNKAQTAIVPAIVFQAAGPDAAAIQSTVDRFRATLGTTNNGNTPGPLPDGRREINWDGGGSTNTSL